MKNEYTDIEKEINKYNEYLRWTQDDVSVSAFYEKNTAAVKRIMAELLHKINKYNESNAYYNRQLRSITQLRNTFNAAIEQELLNESELVKVAYNKMIAQYKGALMRLDGYALQVEQLKEREKESKQTNRDDYFLSVLYKNDLDKCLENFYADNPKDSVTDIKLAGLVENMFDQHWFGKGKDKRIVKCQNFAEKYLGRNIKNSLSGATKTNRQLEKTRTKKYFKN